jgi:hypothetical protein
VRGDWVGPACRVGIGAIVVDIGIGEVYRERGNLQELCKEL